MRRRQFFEVLDQGWCPAALRHGATDYLEAIIARTDVYRHVRPAMFRAMDQCGARIVVDLCSGGGGPWLSSGWRSALGGRTVVLTDKFPSEVLCARLEGDAALSCVSESVDAARVPGFLGGFRTMFSSFHHFPDELARAVLGDAVRNGEGFAMAEVTSRTARAVAMIVAISAFVWLLTPFMRPFRWSRIWLTYVVPLIPLVVFWDGIVSCFRTRTPEELLALCTGFPEYEWVAGYARGGWAAPVYLIGRPRSCRVV